MKLSTVGVLLAGVEHADPGSIILPSYDPWCPDGVMNRSFSFRSTKKMAVFLSVDMTRLLRPPESIAIDSQTKPEPTCQPRTLPPKNSALRSSLLLMFVTISTEDGAAESLPVSAVRP